MAAKKKLPRVGRVLWRDLTVPHAEILRDFYERVVGWKAVPVEMGSYADYEMRTAGNHEPVAGICHARGVNATLPAQWLIYVVVEELKQSLAQCRRLGGTVLVRPKRLGTARYAVIQDPAGAVCALYQAGGARKKLSARATS